MKTPFKRAYKACDRCRKNKSKCELDPSAASCTRCVREQIECNFPAQRSVKRVKISPDPRVMTEARSEDTQLTSTQDRMSKSSQRHEIGTSVQQISSNKSSQTAHELWRPTDVENQGTLSVTEDLDVQGSSNLPRQVLNTLVTNSRDAIDLLFTAADQNDSDNSDPLAASDEGAQDEILGSVISMSSPGLASNETLGLWAQHRFVRQGWFTPREAISYIEL